MKRPDAHWVYLNETQTLAAWELYDLRNDPHEMNNLYSHPTYTKIMIKLKKEMINLRVEFNEGDYKFIEIQEVINDNWNK